jgi:hypothetical protein
MLAAYRGHEAEAARLIQVTVEQATAAGQGAAVIWAHWAAMKLYNGLGRYADTVAAFRQMSDRAPVHSVIRPMTELVEAAARTGELDLARDTLDRLVEWTQVGGVNWSRVEARCRAVLADGQAAEDLYREAIGRYSGTRMRPSMARVHLLYGEWLRREGRRVDAREQLRTAHQLFDAIGMEAFAERARRELLATGETVRKRSPGTRYELTRRRSKSPGSPVTACLTGRSVRSCSSARARSSGTCARCSRSSASAHEDSSGPRCLGTANSPVPAPSRVSRAALGIPDPLPDGASQ